MCVEIPSLLFSVMTRLSVPRILEKKVGLTLNVSYSDNKVGDYF